MSPMSRFGERPKNSSPLSSFFFTQRRPPNRCPTSRLWRAHCTCAVSNICTTLLMPVGRTSPRPAAMLRSTTSNRSPNFLSTRKPPARRGDSEMHLIV